MPHSGDYFVPVLAKTAYLCEKQDSGIVSFPESRYGTSVYNGLMKNLGFIGSYTHFSLAHLWFIRGCHFHSAIKFLRIRTLKFRFAIDNFSLVIYNKAKGGIRNDLAGKG